MFIKDGVYLKKTFKVLIVFYTLFNVKYVAKFYLVRRKI